MTTANGSGSATNAIRKTRASLSNDEASSSSIVRAGVVNHRNENCLSKWFRDKFGVSLVEAKITGSVTISVEDLVEATEMSRRHELEYCRNRAEWAGSECLATTFEKEL